MQIPVCFATNNNFAPHAAALIVSIMSNKLPDDELLFYCFADKLSDDVCKQFRQMELQWNFTLHFIDVNDSMFAHLPAFHGNRTIYFRLAMSRLLMEKSGFLFDKILYLDCDMIVLTSLSELFATDITGKYAAVITESASMPHLIEFNLPYPYFNTGMMLFNLKQYQQDRMEERAFACAEQYSETFLFPDQDIFNVIFGGNVVFVPLKWNCIQHHHITFFPKVSRIILLLAGWRFPKNFWRELCEAECNPSIVHYTNTKPWDGGCNSPLAGEYWKYVRQTPFYGKVRFSYRRICRNMVNVILLGAYPIVHHLFMIRKR